MSLNKTVKATKTQSGNRCFSTKSALRCGFRYSCLFSKWLHHLTFPVHRYSAGVFLGPLWGHMPRQGLVPAAEVSGQPCPQRKAWGSQSESGLRASPDHGPRACAPQAKRRRQYFTLGLILVFPLRVRAAHSNSSGMWRVSGTHTLPLRVTTPP